MGREAEPPIMLLRYRSEARAACSVPMEKYRIRNFAPCLADGELKH